MMGCGKTHFGRRHWNPQAPWVETPRCALSAGQWSLVICVTVWVTRFVGSKVLLSCVTLTCVTVCVSICFVSRRCQSLILLVDCPTRWSLWYWYLDLYVDHLFRYPNDREVQQCAMVLPATNSVDALSKNFSHWPTGIFCQEMISHLKIKLQCASV